MARIHLRAADLRRQKGVSQQTVAQALGVTFQTVSKWENGSLPDIAMLPELAGYFGVSVDQLLGLSPLPGEEYMEVESGSIGYWNKRLDYLQRTRKYLWNQDYLEFLVSRVWRIREPVRMLDCGCGYGALAALLFPLLPEGSSYLGVDQSEKLTEEGRRLYGTERISFVRGDFLEFVPKEQYDLVVAQSVLRHIGRPEQFLERMVSCCRPGGRIVCIDVDRELESDGLYIEGMDYQELCARPGFDRMWRTELEKQSRDYAVGIRLPAMLERAGLEDVDCRMNDRVNVISPEREDYEIAFEDFLNTRGWGKECVNDEETTVERFMNHGMTRQEAEGYCRRQRRIQEWLQKNDGSARVVETKALFIAYGRRKKCE